MNQVWEKPHSAAVSVNQTSATDYEVQNRKCSCVLSTKHHPASDTVQIPQKTSEPFGYLLPTNH